jgi:two-component sensor histidine kinase
MRSVEDTQQSVTELWLSYLRVRSVAGADSSAVGTVNRPSPHGLVRDLERAHAQMKGNRFFEIIEDQNPEVAVWLEEIERGLIAHHTRNPKDVVATNRAFEDLTRFMREHSQQQYRALQTGIWSALLLLLGMSGILARLYSQNRQLAASLSAALDAKSQLIRETHHRVKNNLALVASLVSIKESTFGGEVDLSDLQRRISAVEHVHEMLSRTDAGLIIPMRGYLENLMASVMGSVSMPGVEYRVFADPIELPAKRATALGIIVNETVTNAVKHAFDSGGSNMVEMSLERAAESGSAVLTVSNSGRSLPGDFDPSDCSSLGMQLVSGLVEQLSGTLEILSEPQTAFVVTFPLQVAASGR